MIESHSYMAIKEADITKLLERISSLENTIEVSTGMKAFYQEGELADLLGVTRKTLLNYRNKGMIGFIKPEGSRTILYSREHVEQFMKKHEYKPFK